MSQFATWVPWNHSILSLPWRRRRRLFALTPALLVGLLGAGSAFGTASERTAGPAAAAPVALDLGTDVLELLRAHCAACHSQESNAQGGVRYRGDLNSVLDLPRLRRSDVVDLENPEDSELYLRVADNEMPPQKSINAGHGRALSAAEAGLILDWIRAGAPAPSEPVLAVPTAVQERELSKTTHSPASDANVGRAVFMDACTACHPAGRALKSIKTLSEWRSTILRMGEKPGARLASGQVDIIAEFLAANSAHRANELNVPMDGSFDANDLSVNATISGALRGSSRAERVENKDFTAEAWAQIQWRPEHSPLSGKVTACTTCHLSSNAEGRAIEILEASFRLDLDEAFGSPKSAVQAATEFGRISVPFGAFGAQSNPAAYRTVTRPLIFNMGQLVDRDQIGPAILPMPYADEGLILNVEAPLVGGVTAELDAYLVNGLQGTLDVDFYQSRSYSDNNSNLASGGRLTVGTPRVTFGASAMSGHLEDGAGGLAGRLAYQIQGLDLSFQLFERLRVTAEVARRTNHQVFFDGGFSRGDVNVEGYVLEADLLLLPDAGLSLVTRADSLRYKADAAPFGSTLGTEFKTHRFTWGFDYVLAGGSSLMLNHEHWSTPGDMDSVDIVGMRWVTSF